ncbi:MAG: hypothetical protein A3H69_03750 [Candidatus Sungbacteria bacterium RIFCSPLOWO2_02_FULL_47_9]|uniref:Uncharacterized protein n=1 Tax=Candidatus Sungbacteria bacterium RIFCSPHIGHO2_01_FULL_47_32 TaxID=1802264 RepID=A0A1G2K2N6_9BACT|nr:MAG: hypothetical protein UX72_C0045G0002 [Parcubacteria group bacterium GW2011_GWA2_47_10]OGZ93682.1 MAG: hypothetical protein A2633_06190 [Candidatus Sungbacteria bacterium RIFCSPHIGHO2_01_FULL_47_32]OHA09985.1 MAG: hypothetical protein A3H69_03750 [Candidatus Sungbacteria bacterium RIFCSPLOWO2_02_FULL_47_9]
MTQEQIRRKIRELQRARVGALVRVGVAQGELGNVEAEIKILQSQCPHPEYERDRCKDCACLSNEKWTQEEIRAHHRACVELLEKQKRNIREELELLSRHCPHLTPERNRYSRDGDEYTCSDCGSGCPGPVTRGE